MLISELIKHAIIGFIMAFLGLLSPGFLTLTTLNTSLDRGTKETIKFAIGATIPIFIQAHIALLGAEYFKTHPEIIKSFSRIAIFVFLFAGIFFLKQYFSKNTNLIKKPMIDIRNGFIYGLVMSFINPLAIPFYFTYSTILEYQGFLQLEEPYISIFVLSAMLGAYSILRIYANHASKILGKIQFIARNFKLVLSLTMFLLAGFSLIGVLKIN